MSSRLAAFLTPRSIALVGCPGDLTRPGARPLVYLRQHHYTGNVYPVNPRHAEIGGFKAYPSLAALPERPDIVWIGVPGAQVEAALVEAARVGVPHAVILTAGFGETDAGGRRRQARLAELAGAAGIAVLGPNMLGFINCWDRVPLTFSPAGGLEPLIAGPLGVASQSGALAGIVVNRAFDRKVGVSAMVSTGNEVGITVSECLEYFAEDPRTQAVALVVEGVRDGERFRRAAARLTEVGKPIVALKMGRSNTGRRNALTHTGALAGSHAAWQAVARQLGIVEVETFDDLVEVAGYLSRERRRRYRGVAVVATSGGASIMTADQLEARSIALPRLAPATVAALGGLLPDYAHTRDNPVDVTAGLSEALFGRVLETLVADPGADAVVAVVTGARGVERAENVSRVASECSRVRSTRMSPGASPRTGGSSSTRARCRASATRARSRSPSPGRAASRRPGPPGGLGGRSRRAARRQLPCRHAAGSRTPCSPTSRAVRACRRCPRLSWVRRRRRPARHAAWASRWRSRSWRRIFPTRPRPAHSRSVWSRPGRFARPRRAYSSARAAPVWKGSSCSAWCRAWRSWSG